jgi:xanthine dehydrogenase YagS FAD-binding subunit
MNAFAYVTAQTPESAVELARDEGRFLAGGMDLLGELKESLAAPKTLVNVKRLPGTTGITVDGGRCSIGANVTLAALVSHPGVRQNYPGLAEAAAEVGSPQIRNLGTVGGNLAQHSRCWYYRHRDVHCRKIGGTVCFARQGESKFHSLFTGCMCLSPMTSNLAVALTALDAQVLVQRGKKTETLTLPQLYASAWSTPAFHNSLKPDDLILRVELAAAGTRSVYMQLGEKSAFDWALVSCAAAARVTGKTLSGVRVVLGVVAPIPWQVDEANAFLEGKAVTDETARRAAELILREARPSNDNVYKLPIARALVRRALMKLVA